MFAVLPLGSDYLQPAILEVKKERKYISFEENMNLLAWLIYTGVAVFCAHLHGLVLYKSNTAAGGKQERKLMKK